MVHRGGTGRGSRAFHGPCTASHLTGSRRSSWTLHGEPPGPPTASLVDPSRRASWTLHGEPLGPFTASLLDPSRRSSWTAHGEPPGRFTATRQARLTVSPATSQLPVLAGKFQHPPRVLRRQLAYLVEPLQLIGSKVHFNRSQIVFQLIHFIRPDDDRGHHVLLQ